MAAIARDLARKYDLIYAMAGSQSVDMPTLQSKTNLPPSTIRRLLAILRNDFGMEIEFIRTMGTKGGKGYYQINNWGIIERGHFLEFWKQGGQHV